jgi:hypothetical protein
MMGESVDRLRARLAAVKPAAARPAVTEVTSVA